MENELNSRPVGEVSVSGPGPVSAGFGERLLAYLIDSVPFVIACYVTLDYAVRSKGLAYSYGLDLRWKLGWIAVYILYEAVFSSGGRATLGKFILGLRVKSKDGGNIGIGAAFLRAAGYFVSAAPLNLGYIIALFTPQKRALHDYIAGSRVVRVCPRSDFAGGLIWSVSMGAVAFLAFIWYQQTFMRLSPEDQMLAESARFGLERIAGLEELFRRQYGFYTDDLGKLAVLSGDTAALRAELLSVLDADSLVIAADARHYVISGQAKNRQGTKVQIAGP